ncbi:MAG: ATP-binding protein, partial [Rhodothermales bacterium]
GTPFPREAAIVFVVSIVCAVVPMMLVDDATFAPAVGRSVVTFFSLWGAIVLLRKRSRIPSTDEFARDRVGMLAVASFFVVVAVSEGVNGFVFLQGSVLSLPLFIFSQVLQFTVVLAFPAVYVQYAPEPTTFQVKLVGFVLLIVVSVFGILAAFASGLDEHRQSFDPAPPPETLSFMPSSDGRFVVTRENLSYDNQLGEDLKLSDDGRVRITLPFAFPFAGDTLRSVVVNANGAIEPSDTPYPESNFTVALPHIADRPLIATLYTDLNPGVAGSVHADVRSDRLVVTWKDVPEWSYFLPFTLQAVLYNTGRIDFNYAHLPFAAYVGARGVLTDVAALRSDGSDAPALEDFLGAGPVTNPFTTFDRQIEFKEYLHAHTMPFVWVVLATIAFILLFAPVFYRLALTRPLDRLLQGMRMVNDGDLEAELPVGVKDEIGNLSIHFNRMTRSLRRYANEMESLVDERTRELNESLETLKGTQEQLVQQEKMASLGELTAGIAHEIKNPLNFINNFADLNAELAAELREAIQNGENTDDLLRTLEQNATVIAEHGHRADGIVKSMMEHARHEATAKEPVNVNAFVDEYLNLAYHGRLAVTPEFNVTMKTSYGEDAGSVTIVRQDIGKVLMNLFGNAFDAVSEKAAALDGISSSEYNAQSADTDSSIVESVSDRYKPIVGVSTRREPPANGSGEQVVVEIWDNGPGVPAELKKKIFEPFFTTKPTGGGTGLGLSMSYDIVTRGHGGVLLLDTANGEGTKFVLKLPA